MEKAERASKPVPSLPKSRTAKIEILRPSQLIAAELRAMILRGDFDGDERIPHEPEFAEQLGVSRHHLREALRLLEQDGLVRVLRGHTGGIVLSTPSADVLSRTFEGILARQHSTLADLMDARLVVEPAAAEMAAAARTEDDLASLEAIMESRATEAIPDNNNEFHVAVARASHNNTLLLIIQSLSSLIWQLDNTSISDDNHALGERSHRRIIDAIRKQDAGKARRAMEEHLAGFREAIRASGFDPGERTIGDVIRLAGESRPRG